MVYQIGTHNFVMLTRLGGRGEGPELLNTEQTIIARPGPDGLNVRKDGVRGRPFQMRSTGLFATNTLVLDALSDYYNSQSLAASIVWEDVNFTLLYGVAYIVLRVSEPRIIKLGAGVWETTNITGYWQIEATWDLLPVDAADVIPSG